MARPHILKTVSIKALLLLLVALATSWGSVATYQGNFVVVYGSKKPTLMLNGHDCPEDMQKIGQSNWWVVPLTNGCNYSQWQNPELNYGPGTVKLTFDSWANQGDTIWIYKEYDGKYITNGTELPKSLYMYNPWAYSMPALSLNGGPAVPMLDVGEEHCGWYRAFFRSLPAEMKVSFADANFGDLYGLQGIEDGTAIDVKEMMEQNGEAWILPTPTPDGPPVVSAVWPEEDGSCTFSLAMIIRDMSASRDDFEFHTYAGNPNSFPGAVANGSTGAGCLDPNETPGMVATMLNDRRKPVPSGVNLCKNQKVTEWFTTTDVPGSPTGTNAICIDLPMVKTEDGMWEFDSFWHEEDPTRTESDHVFAPINNFNIYNEKGTMGFVNGIEPGDEGAPVGATYWFPQWPQWVVDISPANSYNLHFCSETAADFTYRVGQKFTFSGDDDFWMFLDEKLAIDLGGLHARVAKTISIDDWAKQEGWSEGSKHRMKIFHCDRNSHGSNFRMKSSIYFEQKRALYFDEMRKSDGSIEYDVKKLTGGENSCAAIEMTETTDSSVVTPTLIYVLKGGALPAEGDTLAVGKTYFGGINILSTSKFSINSDKISGLSPGIYTFFAIDATNPKLKVQVRIRVQGNIAILNTEPVKTLAGRVVPVIIGKALWNAVTQTFEMDSGATMYSLSTSGLEIYLDSQKKNKATSSAFETNEDGLDTLWVTSPRVYTEDKTMKVNLFASSGGAKEITFVTPKLQLQESAPWTYSFVPHAMVARLTWDSTGTTVPCTDCVGDLLLFEGANLVLQDKEGNAVDHLVVDEGALTNFFVLSESDSGALGVGFTFKATIDPDLSHYAEAKVGPLDLQKPPVPVIRMAAMFDDDGDGIPDHLKMAFAEDISDSLPAELSYWFPDTTNSHRLNRDGVKKALVGGTTLEFLGNYVDTILTDGTGQVNWVYEFQGKPLRLSKTINDSCGPVLRTAEVDVTDNARDIITFRFSEKMNVESRAEGSNWFEFRKGGVDQFLDYRARTFSDSGRVFSIYFLKSAEDSTKAIAGDSVRIYYTPGLDDVLLTDARKRHAHEDSRLVRIVGKRRVELGSVDVIEVDVGKLLDSLKQENGKVTTGGVTLVDRDKTPKDVAKEQGIHGFLIPFDQLSNYIDAAGGDPNNLALTIRLDIFTNMAGYFSTYEVEIGCSDALFNGDCTSPRLVDDARPQIFIQWYYVSKNGRMAGSGAYIASASSAVKVRGKTLSSSRETKKAIWGLRRMDKGTYQHQ